MRLSSRPPAELDKPFVRDVHHAGYRDVVLAQFGSWEPERQDQFFEQKWNHPRLEILVADGADCGFAIVEFQVEEIRLVELVIGPAWQGRGLGTLFMRRLLSRSNELRTPVRLQVLHRNRAIELYRRLGFAELSRTETHILMEWAGWDDEMTAHIRVADDPRTMAGKLASLLSEETERSGFRYAPQPLTLELVDAGQLIGGLTATTNWEWLYIETLAVHASYQGQGLGRQLVARAEAIAQERGCTGAWVDTFTFQSPEFYLRLGYEAFGELADYPTGERRIFLRKHLDQRLGNSLGTSEE